jgi:hypothetical protein
MGTPGMNYTKLTLAVTAGILLAAAIILAVIEIPDYLRQRRIEQRFARMDQSCPAGACPEGESDR